MLRKIFSPKKAKVTEGFLKENEVYICTCHQIPFGSQLQKGLYLRSKHALKTQEIQINVW
jgi:hypothetical protein